MKKFFVKPISFVLVLFILFGVFIFPTAAEGTATSRTVINGQEDGIINERVYSFINVGTNKAIDVNAGNMSQGSAVGLYSYFDDTPWQRWKVIYVGNGDYEIVDTHSGLLLSVPGSSASVTNLWIYPRDNTDGQKFKLQRNSDGTVTIYSKSSNYQMALGWNGQALVQFGANNSANQKFNLVIAGYVYSFTNKATGNCIDVSNGNQPNGSDVAQFQRVDGRPWQEWKLRYVGNGMYTIMDMHSGKYLSIEGSSPNSNANAWIWQMDGSTGQQFRIQENSDGTVTFRTVCGESNNMVLTLPPHANNTSTLVQLAYDGSDNQKFYMTVEYENELPEGEYALRLESTMKYVQRENAISSYMTQGNYFTGAERQTWIFIYDVDGYYRIINKQANKYLTVVDSNSGTRICLDSEYSGNNLSKQRWDITVHEYGEIQLQSQYHKDIVSANLFLGIDLTSGYVIQCNNIDQSRLKMFPANNNITFYSVTAPNAGHDHYSSLNYSKNYLAPKNYDIEQKVGSMTPTECINDMYDSRIFASRSHGISILGSNNTIITTGIVVTDDADDDKDKFVLADEVNILNENLTILYEYFDYLELAVFVGCNTAAGITCLPEVAVENGVEVSIGFFESINCHLAEVWTIQFFTALGNGASVSVAVNQANLYSGITATVYGNGNYRLL